MRAALALLCAPALAAALAACGGSGSSSTATSAEPSTPTAASPAPAAGPGAGSAAAPAARAGAAKPSPTRRPAPPRPLVRKAGRAAPFLVPVGDNSVPTYGAEAGEAQRGFAEAALRAYLAARAGGEWSAACARTAAAMKRQLALFAGSSPGAKGCVAAYEKLSGRLPASQRANPLAGALAAFRVKGPQGFALFYGPKGQKYMMPMKSEGGAWRVTQLAPIPWPPGPAQGGGR